MEKDPIKNIELIEAWYEGRLDASGVQHVNDLLDSDPEFKEEFDLYHTLVAGIKNVQVGEIKNQLWKIDEVLDRALPERSAPINNRNFFGIPLAIAAAVIVLLVAGLTWIYFSKNNKEALFAQYYIEDPGLPVFMSNSSQKDLDEAMNHYKLSQYQESLDAIQLLLTNDPTNDTLLYYSGVNLLKLGKPEASTIFFKHVYEMPVSEFRLDAQYRYAVSLWLQNKPSESEPIFKTILADPNSAYLDSVKGFLEK